jgi:hypothetical protein
MYSTVNIFPNFQDEEEEVVAFSMIFSSDEEDEPLLNEFSVEISGNIAAVDSVVQLREMAKEKAQVILSRLAKVM